jgi:hypothetical protein
MLEQGYARESDRFCNCGRRIHRFESESTRLMYGIREKCRSRICDRCSESAFYQFRKQIMNILETVPTTGRKRVGFLTLTFKKQELTKSYVRQSVKAVRRFVNVFYGKYYHRKNKRTGKYSKTKSRIDCGAVAVMEVGKSGNLHFHLLVYGYFRPIKEMSRVWKDLTGDSYRIDIRGVSTRTKQSPLRAAGYILKYVRKPPVFDELSGFLEYWLMLKGLRRIHAYGIFYNHEAWKRQPRPLKCPFCGEELKYSGIASRGEFVIDFQHVRAVVDGLEPNARAPNAGSIAFFQEFYREKLYYQNEFHGGEAQDTEHVDRGGVLRALNFNIDNLAYRGCS